MRVASNSGFYTLSCPRLRKKDIIWRQIGEAHEVLPTDSLKKRKSVESIGRYFHRAFGYDFLPYSVEEHAAETVDSMRVFQWFSVDYDMYGPLYNVIGACGFYYKRHENIPGSELFPNYEGWWLTWIWLHPMERGQGILKRAWPFFKNELGDFNVLSPYSREMQSHLKSLGHPPFHEKERTIAP